MPLFVNTNKTKHTTTAANDLSKETLANNGYPIAFNSTYSYIYTYANGRSQVDQYDGRTTYIRVGSKDTISNDNNVASPYIKTVAYGGSYISTTSQIQIKGDGGTTVTSGSDGSITVNTPVQRFYVGKSNTLSNSMILDPWLKLTDGVNIKDQHQLVGSGGTIINSNDNGDITVWSPVYTLFSGNIGGNMTAMTTTEFLNILWAEPFNAKNRPVSIFKINWSWSTNRYIPNSDTGCGNIHLAGCQVEVYYVDDNYYDVKISTATDKSSSIAEAALNSIYIYRYRGATYSHKWVKMISNEDIIAGTNVTINQNTNTGKLTINSSYTDTQNTAGATNYTGTLYLIGAKEQTANPQTYSNKNVYITRGLLYCNGLHTSKIYADSEEGAYIYSYGLWIRNYYNNGFSGRIHFGDGYEAWIGDEKIDRSTGLPAGTEAQGLTLYGQSHVNIGSKGGEIELTTKSTSGVQATSYLHPNYMFTYVNDNLSYIYGNPFTLGTGYWKIATIHHIGSTSIKHPLRFEFEGSEFGHTEIELKFNEDPIDMVSVKSFVSSSGSNFYITSAGYNLLPNTHWILFAKYNAGSSFKLKNYEYTNSEVSVTLNMENVSTSGFSGREQFLQAKPKYSWELYTNENILGYQNEANFRLIDNASNISEHFTLFSSNNSVVFSGIQAFETTKINYTPQKYFDVKANSSLSLSNTAEGILAASSNTNTYLRIHNGSTISNSIRITGSGATTVSSNGSGVLTITSTDTNTKNTAGATNSTSRLYLIGATERTTNPQTFTHGSLYAESGKLYSSNSYVGNHIAPVVSNCIKYTDTAEQAYCLIATFTISDQYVDDVISLDIDTRVCNHTSTVEIKFGSVASPYNAPLNSFTSTGDQRFYMCNSSYTSTTADKVWFLYLAGNKYERVRVKNYTSNSQYRNSSNYIYRDDAGGLKIDINLLACASRSTSSWRKCDLHGLLKSSGTASSKGPVYNIQVVSALPGSPDANTLYLIV